MCVCVCASCVRDSIVSAYALVPPNHCEDSNRLWGGGGGGGRQR